jgi:hypothetical protein
LAEISPYDKTPELARFIKSVKICSTLGAALVLVALGHVQEAYALCRISDERAEEIMFLTLPLGENDSWSPLQQRFLAEFVRKNLRIPMTHSPPRAAIVFHVARFVRLFIVTD